MPLPNPVFAAALATKEAARLRAFGVRDLGALWLDLMRLAGAVNDQGVARRLQAQQPVAVLPDSERPLRRAAETYRTLAGLFTARVNGFLFQSGKFVASVELEQLGATFDLVARRLVLLIDAGVGEKSPLAAFLEALPAALGQSARDLLASAVEVAKTGANLLLWAALALLALLVVARRA